MKPGFIAIVEDDLDDQDFLSQALQEMESNLLLKKFNNGREFLEFLRKTNQFPEIVITDLRMPYVSGWEVISNLKSNKSTHHIPIAVLSTSANREDIDKATILGACVYHIKPHSPDGYRDVVESIIQKCRA